MKRFTAGVFGGGGSNGDWQAGRLVALKENGIKFDIITGTSVGALNGLAEAANQTHLLEDLWTELRPSMVMKKRNIFQALTQEGLSHIGLAKERKSLHDSTPLRKLLGKLFLNRICQIDYFCSVVIIGDNSPNSYMKHHILKGHRINDTDLDMVWGSTAIPVVFEEVERNGLKLFDGGVLQSTPIKHTIRHFPVTHMIGVVCQPFGKIDVELGKGLAGRAAWVVNAMLRDQFEDEWKNMHSWNKALLQWRDKVPNEDLIIDGLPVKYIEPDLHAPDKKLGNALNFSKKKTAPNFYDGYNSYTPIP